MKHLPFDLWDWIIGFLAKEDESSLLSTNNSSLLNDWFSFMTRQCNKEQKSIIWKICFTKKNMMILGEPGTGKTYLLKLANTLLSKLSIQTQVCAFTGLAGQQADGATLHRIFPLSRFKDANSWDKNSACPTHQHIDHRFTQINGVLFIDEISMISAILFEQIMWFQKQNPDFRFIVLGDFLQLPPISLENIYPRKFFFQTYFMPKIDIFTLTIPQRHADPEFLKMIRSIRINDYNSNVMNFLQKRKVAFDFLSLEDKKTKLYLFHDNKRVDEHNLKFLDLVKMPPFTFKFEIRSINKITSSKYGYSKHKELSTYRNNNEQALIDVPELKQLLIDQNIKDTTLKIGCHIMFNKNIYKLIHCPTPEECKFYLKCTHLKNPTIDIFNGTRAIVLNIYAEGLLVKLINTNILLYFPLTEYQVEISSRIKIGFKIGTHVQFINTNKIAKIIEFENELLTLEFTSGPKQKQTVSEYSPKIKSLPRNKKLVAMIQYYPIVLSYALTIQKSQGMTLDNVVLSLGYIPSPSLVTVAISRCRTSEGVYINGNFQRPQGQIDPFIIEFLKHLSLGEKLNHRLLNNTNFENLIIDLKIKIIQQPKNEFIVQFGMKPTVLFTSKKSAVKYIYEKTLEHISLNFPSLLHLCSLENIVALLAQKRIKI